MSKDNNPPQSIKEGLGGGGKIIRNPSQSVEKGLGGGKKISPASQNPSQGAGSQGSGGKSPPKK